MKKIIISIALLTVVYTISFAQSVGIGTTTPDASSLLELKATNKGFLPPRMTAAEKGLIASPKQGLMIYQTDGTKGLYVYDGTNWMAVTTAAGAVANAWSLNGNAGTDAATSFIGTTDNLPLKFRVNNITSGGLYPTNANVALGMYALDSATSTIGGQNNAIGYNALHATTFGNDNNAFGTAALFSNKTGDHNVAIGTGSLGSNTTADNNAAIGVYALNKNTIGKNNIAVGYNTQYNNVNGNSNIVLGIAASYLNVAGSNIVAIGDSALYRNTMGANVAIGSKALFSNTTGVSNTAVGSDVLYSNTIGNQNTAVGRASLYDNISGIQNTALGHQSLKNNKTGNGNVAVGFQSLFVNVAGADNTAIGSGTLANNTGFANTAVGAGSLNINTSGFNNVAIGLGALSDNTLGSNNVAIGIDALKNNISGTNNTAIGEGANTWGSTFTNATAVGAKAQVACSDCIVLGSTTGYNGATTNVKVGIGITNPQKTLHVNPNGAGGIAIGNSLTSGGYTVLNMGISQESGGYAFLQGVKSSGTAFGNLALNQSGGNVGIRTALPLAALHVKQSGDAYPITDGAVRLERQANTTHWDFGVDVGNDLSFSFNGAPKFYFDDVSGDISVVSDLRMKKDIKTVETALPALLKLQPKTYHYKDNDANTPLSYGFIAQDVEKIFSDIVTTKGPEGLKAIGYQKLNVMAIRAIQEQQEQIELLKSDNKILKEKMEKMEAAIEAISKK